MRSLPCGKGRMQPLQPAPCSTPHTLLPAARTVHCAKASTHMSAHTHTQHRFLTAQVRCEPLHSPAAGGAARCAACKAYQGSSALREATVACTVIHMRQGRVADGRGGRGNCILLAARGSSITHVAHMSDSITHVVHMNDSITHVAQTNDGGVTVAFIAFRTCGKGERPVEVRACCLLLRDHLQGADVEMAEAEASSGSSDEGQPETGTARGMAWVAEDGVHAQHICHTLCLLPEYTGRSCGFPPPWVRQKICQRFG